MQASDGPQRGDRVRWTYAFEGEVVSTGPLTRQVTIRPDGADEYDYRHVVDDGKTGKLEILQRVADTPFEYDSDLRLDGRSKLTILRNGDSVHIRIQHVGEDGYNVAVVEHEDIRSVLDAIILRGGLL